MNGGLKKQMRLNNFPKIPLANPTFDKEMENAALNALRNDRFVLGKEVHKFEEEFAKYCGSKYAISTNSGTEALRLSLIALGIKKLDQVITTPSTFIATANAILHVGATPIFADIDIETYNIDPDQITKRITKHTEAIIPVHLYGHPCDMSRIMNVAESHQVRVLEDACQAHGAECNGSKVGTIGDIGCFSFYSSKNMTVCGDGGMVVTNNEEISEMIAKLRDCGRKSKYVHDVVGYTARLNTVNAAIGRIQLRRLSAWNEKRRRNASLYDSLLSDLDEIVLPPSPDSHVKPVYHLYVIRVEKRDKLEKWLEHNGIQCGIHYSLPIHLQPIYKKLFKFKGGEYPNSELASQTCLSIPLHPSLTNDEIKFISEKIHEFYDKVLWEENYYA
jgi:perosamine synthetase